MIPRILLAMLLFLPIGHLMGCDDPMLQHTLSLRVSQTGFAGETGTIYTVEKDGSWQTRNFVNERISETQAKGVFTTEELAELVGMIDTQMFMPRENSSDPMPAINPKGIRIDYGDQTAALTLNASDEIASCDNDCSAMNVAAWLTAHIESNAQKK